MEKKFADCFIINLLGKLYCYKLCSFAEANQAK